MIYLPINPCPAPRQSRRDRWARRDCVERYHEFRDFIAAQKIVLPDSPWIWCLMPMPASWSRRKRAENLYQRHLAKPDADNLLKAVLDSIFRDKSDSHVWDARITKIWAEAGAIVIASADANTKEEVRKFIEQQQQSFYPQKANGKLSKAC